MPRRRPDPRVLAERPAARGASAWTSRGSRRRDRSRLNTTGPTLHDRFALKEVQHARAPIAQGSLIMPRSFWTECQITWRSTASMRPAEEPAETGERAVHGQGFPLGFGPGGLEGDAGTQCRGEPRCGWHRQHRRARGHQRHCCCPGVTTVSLDPGQNDVKANSTIRHHHLITKYTRSSPRGTAPCQDARHQRKLG